MSARLVGLQHFPFSLFFLVSLTKTISIVCICFRDSTLSRVLEALARVGVPVCRRCYVLV